MCFMFVYHVIKENLKTSLPFEPLFEKVNLASCDCDQTENING